MTAHDGCSASGLEQKVREAQHAMRAAQAAATEQLLLGQRSNINDDALLEASLRDDEVGRAAAAFVAARRHLNGVLRQRRGGAAGRAAEQANAVVSQALGQRVPGVIRLHQEGGHGLVALVVTAVEALQLDTEGRLSGTLTTEPAD